MSVTHELIDFTHRLHFAENLVTSAQRHFHEIMTEEIDDPDFDELHGQLVARLERAAACIEKARRAFYGPVADRDPTLSEFLSSPSGAVDESQSIRWSRIQDA